MVILDVIDTYFVEALDHVVVESFHYKVVDLDGLRCLFYTEENPAVAVIVWAFITVELVESIQVVVEGFWASLALDVKNKMKTNEDPFELLVGWYFFGIENNRI